MGVPVVTQENVGAPVVTEKKLSSTFTQTGKCNNVPGPQNEEAVANANPRAFEPRPRGNQPVVDTLTVEQPPGDTLSQ